MKQQTLEQIDAGPECWVDEYGTPLFRYAMSQVRDPNVAEDLVQETFLAALRTYKSFSGDASFLTWLMSILRRKVVDYRRSLSRIADSQQSETSEEASDNRMFDHRNRWRRTLGKWPTSPSDALEQAEFWKVFENCVAQLPPLLSEVFRLREIMSWEIHEVCEAVGISRGNLAVRLHRARLALRSCLEDRWFSS